MNASDTLPNRSIAASKFVEGLLIAQIRRDKVRLPTDMPDFVGDGLTGFSSDVGDQEAGAFMR